MTDWTDKTILVTGAQGFVGAWLAEALLDAGARVVTLRRDVEPASRFAARGSRSAARGARPTSSTTRRCCACSTSTMSASVPPGRPDHRGHRKPLPAVDLGDQRPRHLQPAGGLPGFGWSGPGSTPSSWPPPTRPTGRTRSCPTARTSPCSRPIRTTCRRRARTCRALLLVELRDAGSGHEAGQRLRGRGHQLVAHRSRTARSLVRGERRDRSDGSPERDYIYVADAVEAYLAVSASLDEPAVHGRAWNAGRASRCPSPSWSSGSSGSPAAKSSPTSGGGHSPRRDRPAVPRLDRDPRGARLGARHELDEGLRETWAWYERALAG